jgi:chemotaxis signal transduction protein
MAYGRWNQNQANLALNIRVEFQLSRTDFYQFMAQLNLLCYKTGDLTVAIQLDRVIGVVESGLLTPLPYSEDAFEGLVEAIGQVMPRVNLAQMLGVEQPDGGILVVVMDKGGSLALRVQQVTTMLTVEGEQVLANAGRARERHELFMADFEQQNEMLYILDVDKLAAADSLRVLAPDGEVMLAEALPPAHAEELIVESHIPFLLVEVGEETYAFESAEVEELHVSGPIREMPGAPEWMLGLIDLRGKPVVALSTGMLLGRPRTSAREVCLLTQLEGGLEVALFVDRALGLERFSPDKIYPMSQTMAGVRSYIVLGEDHIVGIISPQKLVEQVRQQLTNAIPEDPWSAGEKPQAAAAVPHHQLLTVRVGTELFGLTLERIERILASVRLTPLPTTVAHFDGMADVGDGVIPVIDLRRQVQGTAENTNHPPCILTMLEGAMAGILVDQVLSIRDVPADRFEPVKDGSKLPISHVVPLEGRVVSVLTIDRLLPAA